MAMVLRASACRRRSAMSRLYALYPYTCSGMTTSSKWVSDSCRVRAPLWAPFELREPALTHEGTARLAGLNRSRSDRTSFARSSSLRARLSSPSRALSSAAPERSACSSSRNLSARDMPAPVSPDRHLRDVHVASGEFVDDCRVADDGHWERQFGLPFLRLRGRQGCEVGAQLTGGRGPACKPLV